MLWLLILYRKNLLACSKILNGATAWQNQQIYWLTQRRLSSAWASNQSDQSLRYPHEETLGPKSTAKTVQTGRMCRLSWVFAGRTCHFVVCFRAAAQMYSATEKRCTPNLVSLKHEKDCHRSASYTTLHSSQNRVTDRWDTVSSKTVTPVYNLQVIYYILKGLFSTLLTQRDMSEYFWFNLPIQYLICPKACSKHFENRLTNKCLCKKIFLNMKSAYISVRKGQGRMSLFPENS